MKLRDITLRKSALMLLGAILGALLIVQSRSFKNVTDIISRDPSANIFREIQILKQTNDNLRDEIKDLSETLDQTKNRSTALQAIEKEINRDKILAGDIDVYGPGVYVKIEKNVRALWLIDFINELLNAGAESVSINNIRLTDTTDGFDTLPLGQIVVNGSILNSPFVIEAIGEPNTLKNALLQPKGIADRFQENNPQIPLSIDTLERIHMKEVL